MKDSSGLNREQLLSCLDFGKALTSELDPNRLLKRIMEKITKLFRKMEHVTVVGKILTS